MGDSEFAPTIIGNSETVLPATSESVVDVSNANIGFIERNRPKFSDEIATLLRSRLTAASLLLLLVLVTAFFVTLASGVTSLWGVRVFVLVVFVVCYLVLQSNRILSFRQLRVLELVVFGFSLVQLSLMLTARLTDFALQSDPTSVVAVQYLFLGAWCLLILIYAILMPNSWKRGAAVMLPASVMPYLVLAINQWWVPELELLLEYDHANNSIPLPILAAFVGIYGTHTINFARREAYKARQFGQYVLLTKLGEGGMGEVYRAEHMLLKRPCALKLIKPTTETDATAIVHFEKEVKATSRLTHWNTVEIYDYGHADDGTFYYVMELLPGMSLDELVTKYGPLPAERVVHLLRQVCNALQEAHAIGLIHRDIKPANIFAAQRGGVFDVAKILDFGLVKVQSEEHSNVERRNFSGTPQYMSPEQASAYDAVDARADIYSVGCVAYHLLTGQPPFSGKTLLELLDAHERLPVVPPSQINSVVPSDLEQVVIQCLSKDAKDRYADAQSLEQALSDCECAGRWTGQQAAEWWHTFERERISDQASRSPTVQPEIAAIESKSHRADMEN